MLRAQTTPSRIFAAALLLALTFAVPAAAQDQKVAVINTEQVLVESNTGKAALAELRTLQETKQSEGEALAEEIRGLREQIAQGQLSLAEDKLQELQSQFEAKTTDLRRFQEDAQRDIEKRRDTVLASIDQRVMPIITAIGQEQGYSLIFRKFESGLIFASEEVDITSEVIQRLDSGSGG